MSFNGVDPGIVYNNFSPRLGVTYDISGNGRTIARANYARYYGQVGTGGIAGQVNPLSAVTVRYPWTDVNGDRVAQTSEISASATRCVTPTGNWDPKNPTAVGTANRIDPDLRNDTTDEFIIGLRSRDRPRLRGGRELHLPQVQQSTGRRPTGSPLPTTRRPFTRRRARWRVRAARP